MAEIIQMQAINLGLSNPEEEINRVLEIVRMEDSARIKFKSCSLGMKQRIGIAMALLGEPALLILDEPINGLDTDGMRIMREILVDITQKYSTTVLISSHILGELEKIATHYGIIRQGKMIQEISAQEMENRARVFVSLKTKDMKGALKALKSKFDNVREEEEYLRVYDVDNTEEIVDYLFKNGHVVSEIKKNKIGLEEYYIILAIAAIIPAMILSMTTMETPDGATPMYTNTWQVIAADTPLYVVSNIAEYFLYN